MFLKDVRYAVRTLLANPGFTALAILCLSLGIGVNATIFSVVDGVLLRPYPYPDADRLVVLSSANPRLGIDRTGLSYPDYKDWREQNKTLAGLAAFQPRSLTIADGSSEPERYLGAAVSWSLFGLLGTPPVLGRDFTPDDDRPGAEPVVLLSDDLWQRRYNSDRSVVGRSISINGTPHTVIGVMPPRFRFPETQRLWVTIEPYTHEAPRDARTNQIVRQAQAGRDDRTGARRPGRRGRVDSPRPTRTRTRTGALSCVSSASGCCRPRSS